MVVRLSALRTRRTLLSRNIIIFMFLVLIYFRGWVNPRALQYINFCGVVVRVPGYKSRGPGSILGTTTIPVK
jgi:hypothetical protein